MNIKLQTDDYNCGVWLIWYATMWQTAYTTDTTIHEIIQKNMLLKHITNFAVKEITHSTKQTNEAHIEAYRQELRTLYYRNTPTIPPNTIEKQKLNMERENTSHTTKNKPNTQLKNLIKSTQQINELIKPTNL